MPGWVLRSEDRRDEHVQLLEPRFAWRRRSDPMSRREDTSLEHVGQFIRYYGPRLPRTPREPRVKRGKDTDHNSDLAAVHAARGHAFIVVERTSTDVAVEPSEACPGALNIGLSYAHSN